MADLAMGFAMGVEEKELVRVLMRDRSKLIAYIWSIVRDSHAADDIFQEVSLVAVAKRSEISGPDQLLPWLRGVARHKSLKVMAERSTRPVTLDAHLLTALESVWARRDLIPSTEINDALEECTGKLSDKAKRIIGMRYGSGENSQHIAQVMGVRITSIYQALSRIHLTLKDCMRRQLSLSESVTSER